MKKSRLLGVACASFLSTMPSVPHATLIDRGNGLIYDVDLDITWLQDASYAITSGYDSDGAMTWIEAIDWASNLEIAGYSYWRLPSTTQPDIDCTNQGNQNGVDFSAGGNCTLNELGHLFYSELGNSYLTLSNTGPFVNISPDTKYWSSTEYAPDTTHAWEFLFDKGDLGATDKSAASLGIYSQFAWAVHDGDIGAVPLPPALWLFGSGLLGLVGIARRRRKG